MELVQIRGVWAKLRSASMLRPSVDEWGDGEAREDTRPLGNDGLCSLFTPPALPRPRPWGQWLFLDRGQSSQGQNTGQVTTLFLGARLPCLQQTVISLSGVQMLGERPGGCPLRVVSQVRVAAGGDGWDEAVLPTLPCAASQPVKAGRSPASSTWHGVSEAHWDLSSGAQVTGPWGSSDFPARCDLPLEVPAPYGGQMWSWVGMSQPEVAECG